jgi:hypothetical protein
LFDYRGLGLSNYLGISPLRGDTDPLVSTEDGKSTLGLDRRFGDSRFSEPVPKFRPAWWRGITATTVQLKQRPLAATSLREERSADQLATRL